MNGNSLLTLLFFLSISTGVGQSRVIDLRAIGDFVEKWADAHNENDINVLDGLYADKVMFYSTKETKWGCLAIKSERLRSAKYFHKEIVTKPRISVYESGAIKVTFVKRVTSGEQTTDYDAYLVLEESNKHFLIVAESDLVTDRKAGFELDLGREITKGRSGDKGPADSINLDEIEKKSNLPFTIYGILAGGLGVLVIGFVFWKRRVRVPVTPSNNPAPSVNPEPQSKAEADGLAFEKFVVSRFDRSNQGGGKIFKLLIWQSDKFHNGVYAASIMDPDLVYEFQLGNDVRRFAIECKYRRRLSNNIFAIENRKLENYKRYQVDNGYPVSIVLGLGGTPDRPQDLYVIPLSRFLEQGELPFSNFRDCYNDPLRTFFFDVEVGRLKTWWKS